MAKKKVSTKKLVQQKLKLKKPIVKCNKAADEIARIRKNEQARLYRLNKKFSALPKGKKAKKGVTDALRKEIKSQERLIGGLKTSLNKVKGTCVFVDTEKAKIKSLKLQNAAKNRKLEKMYDSKNYNEVEHKKLTNAIVKNNSAIRDIEKKINNELYGVNKHLGFAPVEIARKVGMDEKQLERYGHEEDFTEEEWQSLSEQEIEEGEEEGGDGGGGGAGGGPVEEVEAGPDDLGYIEQMDEVFWTVWQDFDKNERQHLDQYNRVTFAWGSSVSPGREEHYKGTQKVLIALTASEAWRWASGHKPYVRAIKLQNAALTKLKYILYWDQDGIPY